MIYFPAFFLHKNAKFIHAMAQDSFLHFKSQLCPVNSSRVVFCGGRIFMWADYLLEPSLFTPQATPSCAWAPHQFFAGAPTFVVVIFVLITILIITHLNRYNHHHHALQYWNHHDHHQNHCQRTICVIIFFVFVPFVFCSCAQTCFDFISRLLSVCPFLLSFIPHTFEFTKWNLMRKLKKNLQTQIEFVLVSTICATWTDLRRKYYWDQNLNMNTEQGQILIWET